MPHQPTDVLAQPPSDMDSPSLGKLAYDMLMLVAISTDLLLVGVDAVLMSSFAETVAGWASLLPQLLYYQLYWHEPMRTVAGFFTLFLVLELLLRWLIAIRRSSYQRWFFFPFVHWYEVLGCLPQLRALRLLRAIVIVRRLHQLGYQVIPRRWLAALNFYYRLLLEELSDRVILTATGNLREQLKRAGQHKSIVQNVIDTHRQDIEQVLLSMLRRELVPRLQTALHPQYTAASHRASPLVEQVSHAIQQALSESPEFRRYLRMIPIAGSLIEGQIVNISQSIGEQVSVAILEHLFADQTLDRLMQEVAHGVSQVNTEHAELETLLSSLINQGLTSFEAQVRSQQHTHQQHFHL